MTESMTMLEPESAYDLYFGPAHPGSGNFGVKLKIDGEKVIQAEESRGCSEIGAVGRKI